MKILSVDDKVENLCLLEALLRGAGCGYDVVSAHHGVEALQFLEHDSFDLIIADILMPQMDGFELCHQVKQRPDLRHIPFIFYTATYTEKKDQDLGLRLGASRFIIKPAEPEEFLATIREVIQEYEAGQLVSAPRPVERQDVLLKAYNRRLVHKLDSKVQQLQKALEEKDAELAARRKAEAQIRLQAAALEAAANTIIITDREGVILWVNTAFERLTGYRAAEAIGQTPRLVNSGCHSPRFFKVMWDTILTGQVWHGELLNKRKDGSLYHEEMTVTPVRGASGEINHYIAIKQDISERKRAEEVLRETRDALAQANADLERKIQERTAQLVEANANLQTFTYTAAHDLRSPLRAINSFSRMAVEQYGEELGPAGQSLLQRVIGSTEQMQRLLTDLLEYSNMSQAELKLEPVDLRQAVDEALALVDEEIRNKNAAVTVARPLVEVVGHRATVVLLINNFVSNALKFMPSGVPPRVRIWADESDEAKTDMATRRHGGAGRVRLWVEDNGIGIAPQDQEKIFGAFERLHGRQTYAGTGLGLAIVRKAAERMGGCVGVQSELGKGSRFWVELRRPGD
jgi:PAS domain S-box-containing protein